MCFLASVSSEIKASSESWSQEDKTIEYMLWMYFRMQRIIDRSPIWLSKQQKKMLQRSREKGLLTLLVRSKLHYIWHMVDELDVIDLNPKVHSCWGSEKWLSKIKRFVKATHGNRSARLRALQRYFAFLKVRFKRRQSMKHREMPVLKMYLIILQGFAPHYNHEGLAPYYSIADN